MPQFLKRQFLKRVTCVNAPALMASTLMLSLALSGCGGGSGGDGDDTALAVGEDIALAYVERSANSAGNPTDGIRFNAGGDLFMKSTASASATARNITNRETQGAGDVSDPEVSYDGTKLLFSMRRPQDSTWNIWEYDIASDTLSAVLMDSGGDDVDPAYLPDGRIVFSSNRQSRSQAIMTANNIEPYAHLDEYERERVIALHVMNSDGTDVQQISFNQSHDRNPTVLASGKIMFSRWDHVGAKNKFTIFTVNPDGTNLFVHYGAFSGNSFLHPREMEDGRLVSSLMPLSGTDEGGALMLIDIENFTEINERDPDSQLADDAVGQTQATPYVNPGMRDGVSENGRYTTPYPLWDGTNRVLASWTPSNPVFEEGENGAEGEATEGDPRYNIVMIDLDDTSIIPIATPSEGKILTDPVPITSRNRPNIVGSALTETDLSLAGSMPTGILSVMSIYDTDELDLMGDSVLLDRELADDDPAKREVIPKIVADANDPRDAIADLATLKDPALTTAAQRPARFVRITTGVPTPRGTSRETIGETDLEMQRILGYTEVHPDGSVAVEVPADTPLLMTVLDAEGRAFNFHTSWLQVRPNERRTCNGCHSPRRGTSINTPTLQSRHPNVLASMAPASPGETMAQTRTRVRPADLQMMQDLVYEDVWTDPVVVPAGPSPSSAVRYSDLGTPAPTNGYINYPDHIQPLWDRNRGKNRTCVDCHNNNDRSDISSTGSHGLDLSGTLSGTGRLVSYERLMVGNPIFGDDGLPVFSIDDGEIELQREAALVTPTSARRSGLVEKLYEEELMASDYTLPSPRSRNHRDLLSAAELRLINEWIDLGAQYYNDPYVATAGDDGTYSLSELRGAPPELSEDVFETLIHPILLSNCASCHRPFNTEDLSETNSGFQNSHYVLTGQVEGDFNATLSMVNNITTPDASYLLLRPSSLPGDSPGHPARSIVDESGNATSQSYLPRDSDDYEIIKEWIEAAAP